MCDANRKFFTAAVQKHLEMAVGTAKQTCPPDLQAPGSQNSTYDTGASKSMLLELKGSRLLRWIINMDGTGFHPLGFSSSQTVHTLLRTSSLSDLRLLHGLSAHEFDVRPLCALAADDSVPRAPLFVTLPAAGQTPCPANRLRHWRTSRV
jgi:hypothetical protein